MGGVQIREELPGSSPLPPDRRPARAQCSPIKDNSFIILGSNPASATCELWKSHLRCLCLRLQNTWFTQVKRGDICKAFARAYGKHGACVCLIKTICSRC